MANSDENATPFPSGTDRLRSDLSGTGELNDLLRGLPGMQSVMESIRNLAGVDVPVLIEGEPGTAVDFVAQEIHGLSPRRHQPFIVVPWAALPESALANRFFGYEPRAVTSATESQAGLFESADGGTVFFEEIRDVPYGFQIQLARVLKTQEINRIGHSRPQRVSIRFICATRFNLVHAVAEGRFHDDLLYRIRVAHISLPPLREQLIDIPSITAFHLRQCRLLPDKPPPVLSDEAMGMLLGYQWPGNMTELQSVIESAALRCVGSVITPADFPQEIRTSGMVCTAPCSGAVQTPKGRFQAAMAASRGNRTLAARLLGISRATLYRRLKEFGIPVRGEDV